VAYRATTTRSESRGSAAASCPWLGVGQGRAERRDAGHRPAGGDVDGERVERSLDENGQATAVEGAGVFGEPVQVLTFGVERRLGGVEVLRVAAVGGAVLRGVRAADEAGDLDRPCSVRSLIGNISRSRNRSTTRPVEARVPRPAPTISASLNPAPRRWSVRFVHPGGA